MRSYFQEKYEREAEPWNYSFRAAEILRHQTVAKTVRECIRRFSACDTETHGSRPFNPSGVSGSDGLKCRLQASERGRMRPGGVRILDIGCSLGQLIKNLISYSKHVVAMDISEVAVKKAREMLDNQIIQLSSHPVPHFLVGSSLSLPFQKESFEIAVLSDGLWSWQLNEQEMKSTLNEVNQLLSKGGKAIFTDYLQPKDFDSFVQAIEKSPLKILEVRYLYDRLWYQFESLFKAVRHWNWVREILSCLWIAKFLKIPAMLFGKVGSRHILVIAEKIGDGS